MCYLYMGLGMAWGMAHRSTCAVLEERSRFVVHRGVFDGFGGSRWPHFCCLDSWAGKSPLSVLLARGEGAMAPHEAWHLLHPGAARTMRDIL